MEKETMNVLKQVSEQEVLDYAAAIAAKRLKRLGKIAGPWAAIDHIRPILSGQESERFLVVYLDNQHQIIESAVEFYGTIDGAAVYPRAIAKRALQVNAAAVILAHNHPGGSTEPSLADINITKRLVEALGYFDVRVLDHFIVGDGFHSMAEAGQV